MTETANCADLAEVIRLLRGVWKRGISTGHTAIRSDLYRAARELAALQALAARAG